MLELITVPQPMANGFKRLKLRKEKQLLFEKVLLGESRGREVILIYFSPLDPTCSDGSSSGVLSRAETRMCWSVARGGHSLAGRAGSPLQ